MKSVSSTTEMTTQDTLMLVQFEIPEKVGAIMQQIHFDQARLKEMIVSLAVKEKNLTWGQAAEVLGMSLEKTLLLISEYGVSVLGVTREEAEDELRRAESLFA